MKLFCTSVSISFAKYLKNEGVPSGALAKPSLLHSSSQLKYRRHDSAAISMAPCYVANRDNQQLFSEERKLVPTAEKVKIIGELSHK